MAYMTCIGAMWVTVPAFAAGAGRPNQAGLLATIWAAGSLLGGLLLAARGRRGRSNKAYLWLLAGLAVTSTGLLLPHTVPQMAVAIAVFGLPLAPFLATTDELVARAAPAPGTAEAYGWLLTCGQLGVAVGSSVSGAVNDWLGTTAALLVVPVALTTGVCVALWRRRTLSIVDNQQSPRLDQVVAHPGE
jgi:predicted MFS family arabinose efflux permease